MGAVEDRGGRSLSDVLQGPQGSQQRTKSRLDCVTVHTAHRHSRVPHQCEDECDSSSCSLCHNMLSSPDTSSDAEAEQVVPQQALPAHLQGRCKNSASRLSRGFQQQRQQQQQHGGPGHAWRTTSTSDYWSDTATPIHRSPSPPALQGSCPHSSYHSLTVPVVGHDARMHGLRRKRRLEQDIGSTTDLASLSGQTDASSQENSASDSGSQPNSAPPVLDSHALDLFTLQQVPDSCHLGGMLPHANTPKRQRSALHRAVDSAPVTRHLDELAVVSEHIVEVSREAGDSEPVAWHWEPEWADRERPVPARLVHVASNQDRKHQHLSTDMLACIEFSLDGMLLATAGCAKQVRVYSVSSLDNGDVSDDEDGISIPAVCCHRMASKLTSVAWSPDDEGVVSVGDYDGVISQLDLHSGHWLGDREESDGSRLWSVAHSALKPHTLACASSNGTVRIWAGKGLAEAAAVMIPSPGAAVCSVAFSSVNENLLAAASADANAYVFDLRQTASPLHVLQGHAAPLSYVRFLRHQLITSSVDSTLRWWDLGPTPRSPAAGHFPATAPASSPPPRHLRTMRGHSNAKNFVGLSVREEDSLIACGSEGGHAFAYHTSWDTPVATAPLGGRKHRVGSRQSLPLHQRQSPVQHALPASTLDPPISQLGALAAGGVFSPHLVTAVAWRPVVPAWQPRTILAAASSEGDVGLLALEVFNDAMQAQDS